MFWLKLLYRIPILLCKFIVSLAVTLAGIPILAVTLLFIPRERETLPKFLRWFDNHEAHLRPDADPEDIDGLSGPDYYRATLKDPTGWWARFNWLALRNPTNYFNYKVLGFQIKEEPTVKHISGSPNLGDQPGRPKGHYSIEVEIDGKRYWEYYYVQHWFFNRKRLFRLRIGYKLGQPSRQRVGKWIQYVLAITPFKRYKGE